MAKLKNLHLLWIIAALSGLTFLACFFYLISEKGNARDISRLDGDFQQTMKSISVSRQEASTKLDEVQKGLDSIRSQLGTIRVELGAVKTGLAKTQKSLEADLGSLKKLPEVPGPELKGLGMMLQALQERILALEKKLDKK